MTTCFRVETLKSLQKISIDGYYNYKVNHADKRIDQVYGLYFFKAYDTAIIQNEAFENRYICRFKLDLIQNKCFKDEEMPTISYYIKSCSELKTTFVKPEDIEVYKNKKWFILKEFIKLDLNKKETIQ